MRISFFQRAFALPFLAALAFAGCDADRMGSGTWAEEQRSVHTFDRIEANGAIDLFIEVIDGIETSVIVNGDDNLLGDVATQQNGKTLQIDVDGWLHPHHPLVVWVQVPNLRALEVNGAARVVAWGIASKRLDLDLSGASEVTLAGKANELVMDSSGATKLYAKSLHGGLVDLDTSGATKADVCGDNRLRLNVSGASDVRYFGTPAILEQDVSGASEVAFGGSSCATFPPPARTKPSTCSCPAGSGGSNDWTDGTGAPAGDDNGYDPAGSGGSSNDGTGTSGTGTSGTDDQSSSCG